MNTNNTHDVEPMTMENMPQDVSNVPNALLSIQQPTLFHSELVASDVNPDAVASHWSLNTKQRITYNMIITQVINPDCELLSMIITGTARTGKSHIIHAAHDFLARRNESYQFCLCLFTGIAAQNIDGITLHSALSLSVFRGHTLLSKTCENLVKMWANVDFLFVDEYSMIGCRLTYKIHLALTIAKESSKPFGGINIIFASDFCQLPAVGDSRLYTKFSNGHDATHDQNLNAVYGCPLWLSIHNVIVLQTVERQTGSGASVLIELLSRLREGKCTNADNDFLST